MQISVVIPVYNEVSTIREIVARVQAVDLDKEIIIVDDGSTDGTRELLPEISLAQKNVRVFYHDRNQGKGAALRTGFEVTTGDIVIVQDADLEYDPREYKTLTWNMIQGSIRSYWNPFWMAELTLCMAQGFLVAPIGCYSSGTTWVTNS
jgi:glycosyltransferase involved in cell wall biosynthesis